MLLSFFQTSRPSTPQPRCPTEVCSTTLGLPHVNLDVLVALQREWPVGVFLREIHPQIANLVRFWDRHLPLTEVQTTCILCKDPIIRYTPVLGPQAPTTPLFCCRSLVHSACLNIYTRSQAGERDQQVPCLFCDAPQVETHDWRAQEAWQHDPDVRSYLDTLTPHWLAPDMSADICWTSWTLWTFRLIGDTILLGTRLFRVFLGLDYFA